MFSDDEAIFRFSGDFEQGVTTGCLSESLWLLLDMLRGGDQICFLLSLAGHPDHKLRRSRGSHQWKLKLL
jgi:hypothetical protein